MTAKEYLNQARHLDRRINSCIAELETMRETAASLGSPNLKENRNPNRAEEAPFIHTLEKLWEMEEKINSEVDRLVDLKMQIREVISEVPDADGAMVLKYRYVQNMTWREIGREMHADERTVRRWHKRAVEQVEVPKNAIILESCP